MKEEGLDWSFLSPAAEIGPGERTGSYRTTGDQLLSDAAGRLHQLRGLRRRGPRRAGAPAARRPAVSHRLLKKTGGGFVDRRQALETTLKAVALASVVSRGRAVERR